MNIITNNELKSTIASTALYNVIDPEIGLNVVDLGLIYQLDFKENEKAVYCKMTLTTQFCPMGASIKEGVENVLQDTFKEDAIQVELTFDPAWNMDMISEEGRHFLGR
ncbi:MAG: metal-sulfur cluster assembly factor [Bacteroidetes bacterium]|nr:metal-sulfur cluster assembly factor [Bacteroidota bacterium]